MSLIPGLIEAFKLSLTLLYLFFYELPKSLFLEIYNYTASHPIQAALIYLCVLGVIYVLIKLIRWILGGAIALLIFKFVLPVVLPVVAAYLH